MNVIRNIALIFLFSFSTQVFADLSAPDPIDDHIRIGFGGWSEHFWIGDDPNVSNESHNIVAIEYYGVQFGKFDNSYKRETWFIAKVWRWKNVMDTEHLNFTASFGINKGYRVCYGDDDSDGNFCPHGYVAVEYEQGLPYFTVEYDQVYLVHSVKLQPGVLIYNPEIKF